MLRTLKESGEARKEGRRLQERCSCGDAPCTHTCKGWAKEQGIREVGHATPPPNPSSLEGQGNEAALGGEKGVAALLLLLLLLLLPLSNLTLCELHLATTVTTTYCECSSYRRLVVVSNERHITARAQESGGSRKRDGGGTDNEDASWRCQG